MFRWNHLQATNDISITAIYVQMESFTDN